MKRLILISAISLAILGQPLPSFANPLDTGFNRMNSALEQNGINNPDVSVGIQFNVPIDKPKDWDYGFYMPRSPNSACSKPITPTFNNNFTYKNRSNPCSANPEQNAGGGTFPSK